MRRNQRVTGAAGRESRRSKPGPNFEGTTIAQPAARNSAGSAGRSHPLLAPLLVFLVALAWRLAYLARLDASVMGRSLVADAALYWEWAGDLLRDGWWGRNPFFMGPLYPYGLAVVRAAGLDSVPAVLAGQAVLGAAACALIGDAARRVSGSAAIGLVCGLWAAFYEMTVFFDGLVLMESPLLFIEALLVWAIAARAPVGWRGLVGLGVLVGLLAAGRATAALLVPAVTAFAAAPGARGRGAAAVLGGFLLVAAPIAGRNLAVGGEWIPFTYNGGLNLYIGNHPGANGTYAQVTGTGEGGARAEGTGLDGRAFLERTEGRAFTPAASSRHWTAKALEWVRAEPAKAAGLAARRLAMLWNRVEYPQVESVDAFRQVAGPVGLPFLGTFTVLGPLALLGAGLVALRRRGGRGAGLALAYAATVTVAVLPFFVTDRYRVHLVPAAFVLAAVALAELARERRRGPLVAGLALGALIVHLPVPHMSADKKAWGIAADLGARYLERGQADRAIAQFETALAHERSREMTRAPLDATRALERAGVYHNYALALERVGRFDEAREQFARALTLAPDHPEIRRGLDAANARSGPLARGMLEAGRGNLAAAAALFREATRLDPTNGEAWGALVRVELEAGRVAAADSALALAGAAGWSDDAALLHRALVRAVQGDRAGARALRGRVKDAAIAADPRLADVDRTLTRLLARGD
jgi:tetratricopeptide (TPR) repeat protein